MQFHPDECKILSIYHFHKNPLQELPFFLYPYEMNNFLIDYCHVEKDLGICISNKFDFKEHRCTMLIVQLFFIVKLLLNLTSSEELVILLKVLINVERYILQW